MRGVVSLEFGNPALQFYRLRQGADVHVLAVSFGSIGRAIALACAKRIPHSTVRTRTSCSTYLRFLQQTAERIHTAGMSLKRGACSGRV